MLSRTTAYDAVRTRLRTNPRYFLRFYHVPDARLSPEYAFSVDFASGPISGPSKPKRYYVERLGSVGASIVPEQGRSSISGTSVILSDLDGAVLKYIANPQLQLHEAISAGATRIRINDVNGAPGTEALPDPPCTIEITAFDTGDLGIERVRYQIKNDGEGYIDGLTRGVDGTTARAWLRGDLVTNGEQIRAGQRCITYCGYAELAEDDYMPLPTMLVVERGLSPFTQSGFVVQMADILRFLRTEAFLGATQDNPIFIEGHPYDIILWVLLSTGTGTNTQYDVLAAENGLGIPSVWVDVAGIEAARDAFPNDTYCFELRERVNAKEWLETELFKPTNSYPVIIQGGKLTIRAYVAPLPDPIELELPETLSLVEDVSTATSGKSLAESLSLMESLDLATADSVTISETLSLTEALARAISASKAEALGLTESLTKQTGAVESESLGFTENLEEDLTLFRNFTNFGATNLSAGDVMSVGVGVDDVVEDWDVASARSFYVVALETINTSATGRFALPGSVCQINMDAAATAGRWIVKSATAKKAHDSGFDCQNTPPPDGTIGICFISIGSAGLAWCYLLPPTAFSPADGQARITGDNGEILTIKRLEELVTIAAAATTDSTIQIPAGAVCLAASGRVTTIIPTALTFHVGVSGADTRYATAVSTAANTTFKGADDGPRAYAAATSIRFTPNATPSANTGRVRLKLWYYELTPPTS